MSAGSSKSPVTDYTSLDFDGIQSDLIAFAQARFPGELWTDFNDANFDTHLVELMAYATDLLAYNANAQVMEAVVVLLVREQNFRNIGKSLNYTLKSATPAATTLRFVLKPAGTYPMTISSHLQIATTDGLIIFQPVADVAVGVYPGAGYVDVPVIAGTEWFNEAVGTSTGQQGQQYQLRNANLIDGTDAVSVGATSYTRIRNVVEAGPSDKVYLLSTDENGFTTITFGDGFFGVIPPKGQAITATYKTGGGTATNLPASTQSATVIGNIVGTSDGSGVPDAIQSVSNIIAATGGGPRQSLANGKANLPLSLKANDRAVTEGDYAAMAVAIIPGVFKANAVSGKPVGGATPIILFVVPNGGGDPANALKNAVISGLKGKKMAGKRIRVFPPVYVELSMEIDVFVQAASVALAVSSSVRTVMEDQFTLENVNFGDQFDIQQTGYRPLSPEFVPGVRHVFFKTFSVLPYAARHTNSPTTGNGDVQGIYLTPGTVTYRREWLLHVVGPNPGAGIFCNQFYVLQRQLGTLVSVNDTLVVDDAADYEVNSLTGWFFHPNPELNSVTFPILGNTATTITTSSGLLVYTDATDPYVVETQESTLGKILTTTLTSTAVYVAGSSVPVADSTSFLVDDPVWIVSGDNEYRTKITAVPDGTHVQLDASISSVTNGTMSYRWSSDDKSVQFSMIDGTTAFVVGDEMYVDVYPRTGDIALRPENFPLLHDENLIITTIGGV